MKGCIYKLTNMINNKVYIGQTTVRVERRWAEHFKPTSGLLYLSKAIVKYGKDNFLKEVIEYIEADSKKELVDILNNRECFYISFYDSNNNSKGYNLTSGGNQSPMTDEIKKKISLTKIGDKNPNYGKTPSKESIEKMLETKRNNGPYVVSYESKIKKSIQKMGINNPNYGKKYSLEERRIMSENQKKRNFKHTEESKSKMSKLMKESFTPEKRKKYSDSKKGENNNFYGKSGSLSPVSKSVIQYTKDSEFVNEYVSATEAGIITGISQKNISCCCTGRLKSAGGYIWKYK